MTAPAGPITTGRLRQAHIAHGEGAPVYLKWIKAFETGSPEIDALHHELIQECNSLLLLVESGAPWSRIRADAGRLVEGCIQHFRREEEMLTHCRFPRSTAHVAEHRRLEQVMQGLVARMAKADGSLEEHRDYPRALGPMMVDLIIRHDLDYRSHMLHQQGR
jgi:hemerythrin-like metal-binding protein